MLIWIQDYIASLIVGECFGEIKLEKCLEKYFQVVIIKKNNDSTFQPPLHHVVTRGLNLIL
jgi:NADH dehydrogenase FAD-containing subunit